jgi:hypothetical protein
MQAQLNQSPMPFLLSSPEFFLFLSPVFDVDCAKYFFASAADSNFGVTPPTVAAVNAAYDLIFRVFGTTVWNHFNLV